MRVTHPPVSRPPAIPVRPQTHTVPARGAGSAASQPPAQRTERRPEELAEGLAEGRTVAKAPMPSVELGFDVEPHGRAITVTMSDRSSGEVVRKMVYDRSGLPDSRQQVRSRHAVDVKA